MKQVNEGAKTGIFWFVAAVMVAIATFVAWPRTLDSDTSKLIGKPLFPEFEDPLTAASMKIVTYDDQQGSLSQFEVSKDPQSGIWKIPTHAGYPADAEEQMKASATALYDLDILDVPSRNAEDHVDFGVLEPDPEDLQVGDEGVGRLVDFRDDQGETLATLIVGNEVPDVPAQRYVRKPTQDVVYVVEFDDAPLTTRFVDWIDKDLLQLTAFDIDQLTLNNYAASFELGSGQVNQTKKFEATIGLDGAEWELDRFVTFEEGVGVPYQLGEEQTLDTENLNALKQALDELEIAGVGRKPEGMSASLKADKSLRNDQAALVSLLQRGFIPAGSADSEEVDILAANGELIVTQQDGVEYVLRFGDIAAASGNEAAAEDEGVKPPSGSNRYLLVTARVNESQIPVPELEELPETIEQWEAMQAETAEQQAASAAGEMPDPAAQPPSPLGEPAPETTETPADGEPMKEEPAAETQEAGSDSPAGDDAAADDKPAEAGPDEEASAKAESAEAEPATEEPAEETPVEEKPAEENPAEENPDEAAASEGASESGETTQEGGGSASGSGAGQDPAASEEADVEEANAEVADTPEKPSGAESEQPDAAEDDAEAAPPEETEREQQERLEAIQERIAKENQRKLDERAEKIQQAQQQVAELNARFADWYYEISEETFRKLRLSRDQLITTKAEQAAAAGPNGPGAMPQGGLPQFGLPGGASQ